MKRLRKVLFGLVAGWVLTASIALGASASSYQQVKSVKKVDYYTQMGANTKHNYNVYRSGGYQTSSANLKPIAHGHSWANKWVHITREERTSAGRWLKFTYNHKNTGWIHEHGTRIKTTRRLFVPLIAQRPELPTGCEITAVTMMLQYKGVSVTKMQLAKAMPRSSDPNKGFVGSPYKKSGWYVYPKGLMRTVKKYGGSAKNLTGVSFSTFKKYINANKPVVVWLAGVDGFPNHAVTLNGYSTSRAYYNDPWTNRRTSISIKAFTKHHKADANRALSY